MKNDLLNRVILKNLDLVREVGMRRRALQCAVEINMDRQDLTTTEFEEALLYLTDRGLIEKSEDYVGEFVYIITKDGTGAVKGL